ncbi:hypothetical protein HY643_00750, partial [Candidatus Woesearchaeota archaeon]|nr:hypothetical protein [Candidatus Woesearchaeota archaeon]
FNAGWSAFGNWDYSPGCRSCSKKLEEITSEFMKDKKPVDTTFLAKCHKAVLTVSPHQPINALNFVLEKYNEIFGVEKVLGKFGGYGHDGERVLLFYSSSEAEAQQRIVDLEEVIKTYNVLGKLTLAQACDYMLFHLQISEESAIRQPELLLQELEEVQRSL